MVREPACNVDALERLRSARFSVAKIIRVLPDCILYITEKGQAMTAWAFEVKDEKAAKTIIYRIERGFPVEPDPVIFPDDMI